MSTGDSSPIDNLINALWQTSNLNLGIQTVIITSTASLVISISAYFVKRYFSLKDFENQQDIVHSKWLLKKLHKYAEKHYRGLTRSFYNAEQSFGPAITTKDTSSIDTAYQYMSELISKYMKFKDETGGVIILLDKEKQNETLGKIQSLLLSLPFDPDDRVNIQNNKHQRTKNSFHSWINDNNCPKSIALVKSRLIELRSLFDDQLSNILQYQSFLDSRKHSFIKKIKKKFERKSHNKNDQLNQFYIHEIKPKYAKVGDTITIWGNGFPEDKNDEKIYKLKFDKKPILDDVVNKIMTKIVVPSCSLGAHEITVEFPNRPELEEPMGIVIHIVQ